MQFLSEQIGNTRERTSQGYLVLRDVPLGRTGTMLYSPLDGIPVKPGGDGLIRIERDASVVFHPDTIRSFQGVPVTLEHPADDVDPSNWKDLAVGIVLDVRQGQGILDHLLIGDLLITDEQAIAGIESEEYEQVSAGYDANYADDGNGYGRQTAIKGNHLALLTGEGRCGAVCSVGDSASANEKTVLPNDATNSGVSMKNKFIDAVRKAFNRSLDEACKEAEVKDEETKPEDEQEEKSKDDDVLAQLVARIEALEAKLTTDEASGKKDDENKEGEKATSDDEGDDEDEDDEEQTADKGKSRDAASIQVEIQDVISRAEILAPGMKLPTVDAASDPNKVRDSLCLFRRRAMAQALRTDKGRDALTPFVGTNPSLKSLTCDAMKAAFVGASEILKRSNNLTPVAVKDANGKAKDMATQISAMNKRNAEFWARKDAQQ